MGSEDRASAVFLAHLHFYRFAYFFLKPMLIKRKDFLWH